MIIRDLYQNAARRFPKKLGIISGDKRYTFEESKDRINRISNALFAMGLKKGDRVAILDSNKPWYLKLYFGITAGGMIAVPLNYRLAPRDIDDFPDSQGRGSL
ncbi:MAG: AMP-binding protein, partial [Syntrophales bacterium LBB04]|nr:AMP-binding protein [Syntrophales bacterium LBB04]